MTELILPLVCLAAVLLVGIKRKNKKFVKVGSLGVAFSAALSEADLVVSQLQLPSVVLLVILALLLFSIVYLVIK